MFQEIFQYKSITFGDIQSEPERLCLVLGELTPTLKVKRHFVVEKYAKEIEAMYEYETMSSMW